MDLHMIEFDGTTFGMDAQGTPEASRRLKKSVFIGDIKIRSGTARKARCVPADTVAAVMGEAAWLVRERHMERVRWGDGEWRYIIYPAVGGDGNDNQNQKLKTEDLTKMNEVIKTDYQQLMLLPEDELTGEQYEFCYLHKQIVYSGSMAADFVVNMAQYLKTMRDKKAYIAGGFESFGAYAETAVGIKERQAYEYIRIAENLSDDFLRKYAKIGISKLALLAGMSAGDREELTADADVESLKYKELKDAIAEKDAKIAQLTFDLEEVGDELVAVEGDYKMLKNEQSDVEEQIRREVNKAVMEEKVASDQARMKVAADANKARAEAEKLKAEIKALKAAPTAKAEKEIIENPETAAALEKSKAELTAKEAALGAKAAEIAALNKKLTIESNAAMTEFKVKFEIYKTLLGDFKRIIGGMDGETAAKLKSALKAVGEANGL